MKRFGKPSTVHYIIIIFFVLSNAVLANTYEATNDIEMLQGFGWRR
jgi:hypothetical protein